MSAPTIFQVYALQCLSPVSLALAEEIIDLKCSPRLRVGGPVPRGASGPGAPPAAPPGPPAALALMSPPHRSAISGLPTSTLQSSATACLFAVIQGVGLG